MSKKLIPTILTTAAIAGSFGATFALASNSSAVKNDLNEVTIAQAATTGDTDLTGSLIDETIYVFAENNGSVKKTISSDWTKNSLGVSEYKKTEGNVKTPIEMNVSYTLDGKEIKAEDLKGKSGKVTISYNYKNTEKSGGLFVPYAVMTGLILDNNIFENVEVEGGKLVNDGDKSIVAGIAFPGMSENLGVSKAAINIPSSLKVTADAKDFKLGMAMSIATSEIFSNLDVSSFSSLSSLTGELGKLTGGMDQLISGSSALYNGLSELNDKSGALVSGIDQLAAGATELKNGTATLASGLETAAAGAEKAGAGLTQLASKNTTIVAGVNQAASGIESAVTNLQSLNLGTIIDTSGVITDEQKATMKYALSAITTGLSQAAAGLKANVTYAEGVNNLAAYLAGVKTLADEKTGVPYLATKLTEAAEGAKALNAGAEKLENGLATLNAKTPALTDGITKLKNGSNDLRNGLNTFNQQGVERLVSAAGSIENLASRLKNTINLAKAQKPVKYVYRIDEIK
ncbi:hypothetical protein IJH02_02330 [Candidatus Saccharibacteria bacterium]|nr:hypothetical protein [Candidatus Saccharibacteria bacterium]